MRGEIGGAALIEGRREGDQTHPLDESDLLLPPLDGGKTSEKLEVVAARVRLG